MFHFLKALFKMKKTMKDWQRKCGEYRTMTVSELVALSDNDLYSAVYERTLHKTEQHEDMMDGVNALSDAERVFYVAAYYEAEVNNGGLCQFFVNESRRLAPLLPDALGAIGADKHKALFSGFAATNGIDLGDLSSFAIEDVDEYAAQTERYPFDDFDEAFYDLPPLVDYLAPYVRAHIALF